MTFGRVRRLFPVLFVALLSVPAGATPPKPPEPVPYHGVTHGYQVTLPPGWTRIPDVNLQAVMQVVKKAGATNPVLFDSAFQPSTARRPFEYPYVLVQVLPYSALGLNRQINEDEFTGVIQSLTGVDLTKGLESQLSPQARAMMSGARIDPPHLERAKRRFWLTSEMTVAGQGQVKCLTTGYFGRDAIVQVCFYAKEADWNLHGYTGREIGDSLRFDAAKAYSDEVARANPTPGRGFDWGRVGTRSLAGAAVGAVVGMLKYAFRGRNGKNVTTPPPPLPSR